MRTWTHQGQHRSRPDKPWKIFGVYFENNDRVMKFLYGFYLYKSIGQYKT